MAETPHPGQSESGEDPKTLRELREAIRVVESAVERLHMAPAAALLFGPEWHLRKARLALRQAERDAATGDDPRLPALKPMRAQLADPRPQTGPKRRRMRCVNCFTERLMQIEPNEHGWSEEPVCPRRQCRGEMEPVARRRALTRRGGPDDGRGCRAYRQGRPCDCCDPGLLNQGFDDA